MNWLQSLVFGLVAFSMFYMLFRVGRGVRPRLWCWRYRRGMMARRAWMPRMATMMDRVYSVSGNWSVMRVVDIDSALPLRDYLRKYGSAAELNIRYRY